MHYRICLLIAIILCLELHAGNVDTIFVRSDGMNKQVKCVVITPLSSANADKKFPVIYLLHGHSGNYAQWLGTAPQLVSRADELQVIIVCPDAGFDSWYFDSKIDSTVRYESFISSELVKFVDTHYPTKADRKFRAIAGFSMGGHGALYLAIRHKEIYGACGSMSGGLDLRPFPENWGIKKQLGEINIHPENWERNSVINLLDSLHDKELSIIFDCGTDDFFLDVNRSTHQKMLRLKISHDYIERPGGHNHPYWRNSIDYQLVYFRKFFDQ